MRDEIPLSELKKEFERVTEGKAFRIEKTEEECYDELIRHHGKPAKEVTLNNMESALKAS
jgi:hypothetical protein